MDQDEAYDSFSVSLRVAAQQLIDEILANYGKVSLGPLCTAAQRRLTDANSARQARPRASREQNHEH